MHLLISAEYEQFLCFAVHKAKHHLKAQQPEGKDDNRLRIAMITSWNDIFFPQAERDLSSPKPWLDLVFLLTAVVKRQEE